MEFTVATGKGYVPADATVRRRADRPDPGRLAVRPVKKVSYKVENTREGQISTTTS
jgi:DNA-directed RNA polymerase alpha subunit